jgi:acyl-lipid (7-3)-desaturase (Delta-4 desaturase)
MLLQQQQRGAAASARGRAATTAAPPRAPAALLPRRRAVAARVLSDKAPTTANEDGDGRAGSPISKEQLARLEAAAAAPPSDPWSDPKWQRHKWTVYRGQAYDLTSFMKRHPAGSWLLNLAVGRDCTALFESYHLRPEVAAARLGMLPKLEGFPVDAIPRAPYPNDSELYNAIRDRVRKEVFKGGEAQGKHRSGSEYAVVAILGSAALAYALYVAVPGAATGALLGLAGAWIGLTVQHCGNHGVSSLHSSGFWVGWLAGRLVCGGRKGPSVGSGGGGGGRGEDMREERGPCFLFSVPPLKKTRRPPPPKKNTLPIKQPYRP